MIELQEELQRIQNENLALYEEVTKLRQQKDSKEHHDSEDEFPTMKDVNTNANASDNNNTQSKEASIEDQIEMLISQQKKEEENRSAAQKKLQDTMQKMKSLQESIDQQNSHIQRDLTPQLHNEETSLEEYYKNLIEICGKHPNLDTEKLKDLVNQFTTKSKEVYNETEEIEKLHRLIQYNEPHYTHDEDAQEEDSFENPLPCFSSQPPSLEEARTRRRVSFTLQ